ncbi:MAG TPA: twin-arginine translocase TatA/TatE family subunit [Acidimicrobiales bacterium]|jgi:sec-independent protein translocase protein TatA|nr:twin-arginine translocase TatA/TatE family subunit [Acidimicrobiales bacterium]
MGMLGSSELLIVLAVVVLLFGSSQLPKLARSLGQAQRELREGMQEIRGTPTDHGSDVA